MMSLYDVSSPPVSEIAREGLSGGGPAGPGASGLSRPARYSAALA